MPSFLELQEKYKNNNAKLIDILSKDTIEDRQTDDYISEYSGERTRRPKSVGNRTNKTADIYEIDDNTGEARKTGTKTIITSKLAFPFPKKIVRTRTHFLFGGKMVVNGPEAGDALSEFKRVWSRELKMQNVLKSLARICMVETKAAVVFYPSPVKIDGKDSLKLRAQVLKKSAGDFFPHFDDYGDMDAFIYKFKTLNTEGKPVEKVKIYTDSFIYNLAKNGSTWEDDEIGTTPNLFTKIPVVYVEQNTPEWEDIAGIMDNTEMRVSRMADTNDYFAEPLLKIFGDVAKLPGKEEVGKVLEFKMDIGSDGKTNHGDAEYATWDQTPESIKLELETYFDLIYSMTSTPDLSFRNTKGIGTVSGVSLRLMFLDAFIAREEKMEIFDPALRRCISVVTAGMVGYTAVKLKNDISIDDIDVSFTEILPQDIKELVETIYTATGGKPFLSQESGASISPLTQDANEEITRLKAEESSSAAPNESFIP